jgi:hypothetical protein
MRRTISMVRLKILDLKNYSNDMPKIISYAARSLIFKEDKLAMIFLWR